MTVYDAGMNERPTVLVVAPDLMMRQKIVGALTVLGYPARGVAKPARLDDAITDGPVAAILIEVDGADLDGPALTASAVSHPARGNAPVVGFCSHMRTELMDLVRAAGADRVIARGELVRRLEQVMREVVDA